MKLFNLDNYLKETDKTGIFKLCKKRKTYDPIALNILCSLFNYTYSIQGTVFYTKNKRIKYDLIKFEKLCNRSNLSTINKFVKYDTLVKFFKKLCPQVEVKTIARQYKYAPEIKEVFYALRTL